MKKLSLILISCIALFSCKKESAPAAPHTETWYRALAVGQDTAYTRSIYAKAVTYQYKDSDAYMQIQLLGYSNGQYVLAITNQQHCDVDFQIDYEGMTATAISPNRKNNLYYNQVKANKTETFYITGNKKVGKIKVMANTICTWQGCNPVWLYVDITQDILPIVITNSSANYVNGNV